MRKKNKKVLHKSLLRYFLLPLNLLSYHFQEIVLEKILIKYELTPGFT